MTSSIMTVDALRVAAALASAGATGLQYSFSVIAVPLVQAPEPNFSAWQRWRLWRKSFERGQATIPTAVFGAAGLLAAAAYAVPSWESRKLLIGAVASHLGVCFLTPIVMLGANLRGNLLESIKSKDDEKTVETWVSRFMLFQNSRTALCLLGTLFSAYELLISRK